VTGGGVSHPDGRTVCKLCCATAIDTDLAARPVLAGVRAALARMGLDVSHPEIAPHLVDQRALRSLAAEANLTLRAPLGLTQTRYAPDGRRTIGYIYVLDGLPRVHTAMLFAHEIGHAWLFLHEFPALPLVVEEGLCELWASRWLAAPAVKDKLAQFLLQQLEKNTDPVYGDGYRAARKALRSRTLPGLLEYTRRHRSLPGTAKECAKQG
jgi:hypothetical protein